MNMKIPKIVIMTAISLIVIATVLIPVINDAQEVAGASITKINGGTGHTFKEMVPGDVLECVSVYSDNARTDTWTLNGNTVLNEGVQGVTWDWGLISDVYFMQINAPNNSAIGSSQNITGTPGAPTYLTGANSTNPNRSYSWTMNDDKSISYVYSIGETTYDPLVVESKWAYVISSLEDGAYMSAQLTTNSYYAKLNSTDVILAGNYTTGNLDTGYYYGKDGVLTVVNTSYTGSVNFTQTKTNGTTDIYDTLLTVTISDGVDDETFSPYRALVPYQVTGHESAGAAYSLYGVLPIMVIAAVVIGVVGLILIRRE